MFAGTDATIGLGTMKLDPAEWPGVALASFTASQAEALADWVAKFREKYAIVGACADGARPTTLAELRARCAEVATRA